MLDKQSSKAYRKLVCAEDEYQAFKLVDSLKPEVAKRVLIRYIMNKQPKAQ
ncbi:hypothetical protein NC797_07565 [Aquibacillus sp. 3ASR75-11]|uniref:Uncharacterized protein n=1 Tax=Terrihalobacillus insolitus TaxID=2950438 RepID=A0A9X3WT47_9BACI|nr:hypothetical protein [Terrihalobacillus insolitus]MDC3424363.1 hypothetical protein [Terrihalobacillus insolitus]